MPIGEVPIIPNYITVHLGVPSDTTARNITLPFPEYIANVASSEIFPTWPEESILANMYVIITYALNRYYTEWYPSQGYPFDITNSTAYDQAFVEGRVIFDNISQLADEMFNNYIRRKGDIEPLFSSFCNGTTVTCDGLSQWGTVPLANQGMSAFEILQYYYGDDIEIVRNAPVADVARSYPGTPLKLGDVGNDVAVIEIKLNRIAQAYPSIPKVEVNGVFGPLTEKSVREFQRVFNLTVDGIVGKATWYKINYIYTAVKELSELTSEGLEPEDLSRPFTRLLRAGSTGPEVTALQYYLNTIGLYEPDIPRPEIDGIFGDTTEQAVIRFQEKYGLKADGIVGVQTVRQLQNVYSDLIGSVPANQEELYPELYPGFVLTLGTTDPKVTLIQRYLQNIARNVDYLPAVQVTGTYDEATVNAVRALQDRFGIPATGTVGPATWYEIIKLNETSGS